ncbi:PTS transporter subunit EIIC [Klebsiella pneumoniae]|nr:PTS transporter subunit EIIC [Klebsiella pneumoniae]
MLSQIQRFGGAMFTPVLLFPFAGIVVGIAIMLRNPMFVGEALTAPDSLFAQIVHIIEEGGWTVFRNMPLIFAVGLPIGTGETGPGPGLSGGAGELSHLGTTLSTPWG